MIKLLKGVYTYNCQLVLFFNFIFLIDARFMNILGRISARIVVNCKRYGLKRQNV